MINEMVEKLRRMPPPQTREPDDVWLLVDGMNAFIRSFAASPAANGNGVHVGGIVGFLYSLGAAIKRWNPTRCIVVWEGEGGAVRKRKIFPEYKANRSGKPTSFRKELRELLDLNDDQINHLRKWELARLIQYLDCLPITMLSMPSNEADDIIAYIIAQRTNKKTVIVSNDRDFLQLARNDQVIIWNPTKKEAYDEQKVYAEYNVYPCNFVFYKALVGDASDNIPGVGGIGKKRAVQKIEMLSENQPISLDELVSYSQRYAIKQIVEAEEVLRRNYAIMQLSDPDIANSTKMAVLHQLRGKVDTMNRYSFYKLCAEDLMAAVFKNPSEWLSCMAVLDVMAHAHNNSLEQNHE